MGLFSEGHTLIYCDSSKCKHIRKHKLYRGKPRPERGEKYINVCGRKFVTFCKDTKVIPELPKRISILYCVSYEKAGEGKDA